MQMKFGLSYNRARQRLVGALLLLALTLTLCPPQSLRAHELVDWQKQVDKAESLAKEGKPKEAMAAIIKAYQELQGVAHARDAHQSEFELISNKLASAYKKAADWTAEYRTLIVLAAFYRYQRKDDTIEYADCLWRIGVNCDQRKQYKEGLANLEQAAEIYLEHPSITEERISQIDRGLGHLYSQSGQYDKAKQKLDKAIKLSRHLVEERAHDLGRALLLKGKCAAAQKDYRKAFDSYREAVEVFEDGLVRGHYLTSQALDTYAGFVEELLAKKKNDTSGDTKVLISEEQLLRTLSDAYLLNNRFYRGKESLEALKSLYEENKQTQRMDYGRCLEELGFCCQRLKDYKDGLKYQSEAVSLYRDTLSDRDSQARAELELAQLQYLNGDRNGATKRLSAAESNVIKIHGDHSINYGECLVLKLKWLVAEEGDNGKNIEAVLAKLRGIYVDVDIPQSVLAKKALQKLLLKLDNLKSERLREYLFYDWQKYILN